MVHKVNYWGSWILIIDSESTMRDLKSSWGRMQMFKGAQGSAHSKLSFTPSKASLAAVRCHTQWDTVGYIEWHTTQTQIQTHTHTQTHTPTQTTQASHGAVLRSHTYWYTLSDTQKQTHTQTQTQIQAQTQAQASSDTLSCRTQWDTLDTLLSAHQCTGKPHRHNVTTFINIKHLWWLGYCLKVWYSVAG